MSTHSRSRLTAREVIAIRKSKKPQRELAEKYGVTVTTISHVQTGRTHRDIGGPIREPSLYGKGSNRSTSHFDDETVRHIRNDRRPINLIADDHGVSYGIIYKIKKGITYRESGGRLMKDSTVVGMRRGRPRKLTPRQVKTIRSSSKTAKRLSSIYKVSPATIHMIRTGSAYSDVE